MRVPNSNEAYEVWNEETQRVEWKKPEPSWFDKLSKWFAGLLYLGGTEYVAEEAGSAASEGIVSSLGIESGTIEPETIEMQHIQLQPDITVTPEPVAPPVRNIVVQADVHEQVEVPDIIVEEPQVVPPELQSTIHFTNPSYEPAGGHELPFEDPLEGPSSRYNPNVDLNLGSRGVDLGVDLNYEGPTKMTSTPIGRGGKKFNWRLPWQRRPIEYGTEEYVYPERNGYLAKVNPHFEMGELRAGREYMKTEFDLDRISSIHDTSFIEESTELFELSPFDNSVPNNDNAGILIPMEDFGPPQGEIPIDVINDPEEDILFESVATESNREQPEVWPRKSHHTPKGWAPLEEQRPSRGHRQSKQPKVGPIPPKPKPMPTRKRGYTDWKVPDIPKKKCKKRKGKKCVKWE